MKKYREKVQLTVRENPAGLSTSKFQAEIIPNNTYADEGLYEKFASYLGLPREQIHLARTRIGEMEGFIRSQLEQGNRLDFELVSFYPRLASALPARDADPEECGISIRGGVKPRRALSAALDKYLIAENPCVKEPIRIYHAVVDEDEHSTPDDVIVPGRVMVANTCCIEIDATQPDEGIWLEKPITRWNQKNKHVPIAHCTYLRSDGSLIYFRLDEPVKPGRYMLAMGTRCGKGPAYQRRIARHLVRVV